MIFFKEVTDSYTRIVYNKNPMTYMITKHMTLIITNLYLLSVFLTVFKLSYIYCTWTISIRIYKFLWNLKKWYFLIIISRGNSLKNRYDMILFQRVGLGNWMMHTDVNVRTLNSVLNWGKTMLYSIVLYQNVFVPV